jgi:hypothetical protein
MSKIAIVIRINITSLQTYRSVKAIKVIALDALNSSMKEAGTVHVVRQMRHRGLYFQI